MMTLQFQKIGEKNTKTVKSINIVNSSYNRVSQYVDEARMRLSECSEDWDAALLYDSNNSCEHTFLKKSSGYHKTEKYNWEYVD